jgi:RNA polymerase sigma-70 factor (ECF subfamily)
MDSSRCDGAEARFASVFAHLGSVTAYLRRRGSRDPEAVAAEVMLIAWRRLADVPTDDPRPWLYVTARNLLYAEHRTATRERATDASVAESGVLVDYPSLGSDPEVARALGALTALDRQVLLLVTWDDLTPSQAAKVVGISPTAFRMRLLRARRRFQREFSQPHANHSTAAIPEAR